MTSAGAAAARFKPGDAVYARASRDSIGTFAEKIALRENFVATFLQGYESEAPLSHAERESLGFMAVLNWMPHAGFYAQRRPEEGDERIARRLRFDLSMMRAIGAEMQRLAPQFGWAVL